MWFLIRTGFWLSLALLVLPLGGNGSKLGMVDALLFARSAVSDVSGLCQRNAKTCETGRELAGEVAMRAREAAHIATLYFDAKPDTSKPTDKVETGSVKPRPLN